MAIYQEVCQEYDGCTPSVFILNADSIPILNKTNGIAHLGFSHNSFKVYKNDMRENSIDYTTEIIDIEYITVL